jgi:hypothetical protein
MLEILTTPLAVVNSSNMLKYRILLGFEAGSPRYLAHLIRDFHRLNAHPSHARQQVYALFFVLIEHPIDGAAGSTDLLKSFLTARGHLMPYFMRFSRPSRFFLS